MIISDLSCSDPIHGDVDVADKEMQLTHREFLNERDSRNSHSGSHSRLRNIDHLTDMGFNLSRFSHLLTVGDTVPQTPVGSGTTTPVPTSTPRPNGRSCLHKSDPIPNWEHMHAPKLYNSFTDLQRQVNSRRRTGPELGPESLGTDEPTPTFDMTKLYPGEIPFRNQGMSTASPQHVEPVRTQTILVNMPRGMCSTQTSPPRMPNTQSHCQTSENNPPTPTAIYCKGR